MHAASASGSGPRAISHQNTDTERTIRSLWSDGKRPDSISLTLWRNRQPLTWGVKVVKTLAVVYYSVTSAAAAAEMSTTSNAVKCVTLIHSSWLRLKHLVQWAHQLSSSCLLYDEEFLVTEAKIRHRRSFSAIFDRIAVLLYKSFVVVSRCRLLFLVLTPWSDLLQLLPLLPLMMMMMMMIIIIIICTNVLYKIRSSCRAGSHAKRGQIFSTFWYSHIPAAGIRVTWSSEHLCNCIH